MRSTSSPEATITVLLTAVPEDRLRALVVDFLSALLSCLTCAKPSSEAASCVGAPPADGRHSNGRRRRRAAMNAKRRAQYRAAKARSADNGRRRGRKPKAEV